MDSIVAANANDQTFRRRDTLNLRDWFAIELLVVLYDAEGGFPARVGKLWHLGNGQNAHHVRNVPEPVYEGLRRRARERGSGVLEELDEAAEAFCEVPVVCGKNLFDP